MSERLIPGRTGIKADVVRYLLSLPVAVRAYIDRLGTRSVSEKISDELVVASSEVLPEGRIEVTALELFEELQRLPDEGTKELPNVEVIDLARQLVAQAAETRRHRPHLPDELQAAANELPRDQQLILGMHVNEELTFRQIAEELRIPPEVVLKLLGNAYSTLRLRLYDPEEVSENHCASGQ